MKTIEDLYYGNINPNERSIDNDPKLKKILHDAVEASEVLYAKLNDEQKAQLEDYQNKCGIANCELEFRAFLKGFRLSSRLLVDALIENDGE